MAATARVGPNDTAPPNSSGIQVIVVGTGLGGLSAAVECHRKGHSVIVFDKLSEITRINGDIIGLPANGGRIFAKWGNGVIHETLLPLLSQTKVAMMHDAAGKVICADTLEGYSPPGGYTINRRELVWVLFEHAQSLGIDIRLDSLVTGYWETDTQAGVVVNGERIAADCVICSDGVHSSARLPVVGQEPTPQKMGIATFRGYYSAVELAKDPEARWLLEGTEKQDNLLGYFGDSAHVMAATLKNGEDVFWMCVHEDVHRSSESWSNNGGDIENAVTCIKDWPFRHKLEPIIRQTPQEVFIDRQLIARDPLKTWVSPRQRMILIGDAAHPSLPAGGQGAGQSIEDGAVLAIALELAGKDNVPLALCVAEKIRYKRATIIQQGSFVAQAALNELDWDEVAKNPDTVKPPRQTWIFSHDCQKYTYQEFDTVTKVIRDGGEYVPHNIPDDGKYILKIDYKGIDGEVGAK